MTDTFRNPVLPGFNPDPSICAIPGVGYLVSTSTFEFFPGLPLYFSKDLQTWTLIGHAINRRSQGVDMRTVESSAGLWAPTLRYHNGRVYMICSCFWRLRVEQGSPQAISSGFYVWTDDFTDDSKWSDAVYFDEVGFDQDLLFDDDGRVYQTVTRFDFDQPSMNGNPKIQSFINEIDLASGRSLTRPVLAKASDLGVAEGCHIIKKDGWYYFFTAEGGTQDGHRECVYRSKSPLGPFEPPPEGVNPIIYNGDHPDIQNTGHLDMVPIEGDSDGRWIAVFLGVRPIFESGKVHGADGMPTHLGRESFMAEVEWVDGWPVVNRQKPIELVAQFKGLKMADEITEWEDAFGSPDLALGWYRVRVPLRDWHSLTDRPGQLALQGSPLDISIPHSPSVVLQKQVRQDCDWSTDLTFGAEEGEEAGTVVWLHEDAFAALGLRGRADRQVDVVLRAPADDTEGKIKSDVVGGPYPAGTACKLVIKARREGYTFAYEVEGKSHVIDRHIPAKAFTPLFTGVHLGLYAQGANEVPTRASAYFKYARWTSAGLE